MYVPSLILISFVLSKIWPGKASIIEKEIVKWLWGDNSINIQGRIMAIVHCPSFHCHLSLNQVSSQSLLYFQRHGRDKQLL